MKSSPRLARAGWASYVSRDSKLGRDAALKVLPAALAAESERLARFEREPRLLAACCSPALSGDTAFTCPYSRCRR